MPHHSLKPMLAMLLLGLAIPAPLAAQDSPTAAESKDASLALLRPAWHFGRPLYAMAQARAAAGPANIMAYQSIPDDPRPLDLALPNTDLLHATAWLDLSAGPVILTMPPLAGRYHSVAISSMATDLLALLGTRTGSQGGRFALISTDYNGPIPEDATPLRLGCKACRLVARVLIKSADDLESATQALTGMTLSADTTPNFESLPATPSAADWLAALNMVVATEGESSLLAQKAANLEGLSASADTWETVLPVLQAEFQDSLASASDKVNGWTYPGFAITDAAADDLFRAQMADAAPHALPRVEAMEMQTRQDDTGQPLDGEKAWRLRLPYNLPVGGFWSVSMFQIGKDGRLNIVANELNRYAVGDRSEHLRADRNGSTELFIQTTKPEGERVVNWLPAPKGRFALVFRAYLPKSELLDGSFRLPPVIEAEPIP